MASEMDVEGSTEQLGGMGFDCVYVQDDTPLAQLRYFSIPTRYKDDVCGILINHGVVKDRSVACRVVPV